MPVGVSLYSSRKKNFVVRDDPYINPNEDSLEFKLTYDGLLLGSQSSSPRAPHKHDIRRQFHPQMKRLWEINPHLLEHREPMSLNRMRISYSDGPEPTRIDLLASRFGVGQFRFVPFVTSELQLLCTLDILWLRPDPPGAVIQSGDLDNRLKTLFDALKTPTETGELGGASPQEGETPFFTLLQDDRLVTKVSVATDVLLQPVNGKDRLDDNDVRLVITVQLRPTSANWASIDFL
jgi:hypothetical protein